MEDQALKLLEYHCNKVFIASKNHKWYKIIETSNLRGHSWVLQLFVVVLLPSHATPLYCASVSIVLNLAIVPPPQNLSHEFHCPHSPHTQSTKDVEERNPLSNYIWLDFQGSEMKLIIIFSILLGQFTSSLQAWDLLLQFWLSPPSAVQASDVQFTPPCWAGVPTSLVLVWVPPWHVELHSPNAPHSAQTQFTEKCYNYKFATCRVVLTKQNLCQTLISTYLDMVLNYTLLSPSYYQDIQFLHVGPLALLFLSYFLFRLHKFHCKFPSLPTQPIHNQLSKYIKPL